MVAAKYAQPSSARRNLEILVAATLEASAGVDGRPRRRGRRRSPTAMATLADARARRLPVARLRRAAASSSSSPRSRRSGEISTLNVGSRPASRTGSGRIEDLRAIPWVFGWTQCRLMLPGWYGSGAAFEAFAGVDDATPSTLLRRMHERWPFFRTVIDNMGMVLAKADLGIGTLYADALVPDEVTRRRIMDRIVAEHRADGGVARPDHRAPTTRWPTTRRWPAASATATRTSTRCTSCRSSCCAATAPATTTSSSSGASS